MRSGAALADEIDHDDGRRDARTASERLCAITRTVKPVNELIRFVLGPDGVVPDIKRNLPGRGVWVSAHRPALEAAVKARVFGRAFKTDARVAADLPAQTQRLLERHALDALAMARKAGQAVCGFSRVEEALAGGGAVLALLHAGDASPDGMRKMVAAAGRLRGEEGKRIPVISRFASAHLDLAFGRSNVVHAALLGGSSSTGFLARWQRLEQYMGADGGPAPASGRGSSRAQD